MLKERLESVTTGRRKHLQIPHPKSDRLFSPTAAKPTDLLDERSHGTSLFVREFGEPSDLDRRDRSILGVAHDVGEESFRSMSIEEREVAETLE
jgi:hypothetical protein